MSDSSPPPEPPAWVRKKDNRLVPFEPDIISQALFAATEELGKPDAFLARELTEGVVHFLAVETEGTVPTTAQIAELTIKVVRELGQPALAQMFARSLERRSRLPATVASTSDVCLRFSPDDSPTDVTRAALCTYSLHAIYSRDLAAAQKDGLLTLTGLERPLQLAGGVLPAQLTANTDPLFLVEAVAEARPIFGDLLVLDGLEHALACQAERGKPSSQVRAWVRELVIGLRATGLRAVVNLNSRIPPAWADQLAQGPLFANWQEVRNPQHMAVWADALLQELIDTIACSPHPVERGDSLLSGCSSAAPLRIDWHLSEEDFYPEGAERLARIADFVASGKPIAFTFDRPRRDIALAEGMDRRHPAVMLTVGIHLPGLARQVLKSSACLEENGETQGSDARGQRPHAPVMDLFLQKLGTLARLALSAGVQKREFLRRHKGHRPALTGGFLLDRARLVVAPVGLEETVKALVGCGMCDGGTALGLARQIVQRLRDVLREDGGRCQLDAVLDGVRGYQIAPFPDPHQSQLDDWPARSSAVLNDQTTEQIAGLTSWDWSAPLKNQLRVGAALHNVTGTGTLTVLVPPAQKWDGRQVEDILCRAWEHPDLVRLRFVRREQQARHNPLML